MKHSLKNSAYLLFMLLVSTNRLQAQCDFIPSTSTSIDTVVYTFSGGSFASYGCAPIDPTYWLSGNGIYVIATFVNSEAYPSFRVWGMNDDDSAAVEINGAAYPLDQFTASYTPKVVCGISPGPDGIIFSNGKIVGANTNGQGNYSYQDITINATGVLTLKVTGTSGAGWGFAGVLVDCAPMPTASFAADPDSICPGTCISITNLSSGAVNCQWIFQGANPSTDTSYNPSGICYPAPGSYDVTLIASNASGYDTLTLNNFITVFPTPPPQGISQNGDTLFAIPGAVHYQWYHGGNLIPGATDYFFLATESGDYNVVAADANGCEVEAAIFDVSAGLNENFYGGSEISTYPNPACEKLEIRIPKNASNTLAPTEEITIYNIVGNKVCSALPENRLSNSVFTIDIKALKPGTYFLQVTSAKNDFRTLFVKQ